MIYVTDKEWRNLNDLVFKIIKNVDKPKFDSLVDLIYEIELKNTAKNSKPNIDQFKDLGDCV